MANKQYLNYDPDTNQLYLCDNCETNPVYTKTTFNTNSLSVHDDNCLYMKAVDGNEYKISESLLGPKGDQGDKGSDGNDGKDGATLDNVLDSLAIYHLELSNDMDQVYVKDDNYPVITLTISTNITLYKNGSFADLEDENSKWEFEIINNPDYAECKIEDRKASFTYNPSKKVSDSSRIYTIKAVLKDKEDDSVLREVIKDFKVKRIVGTTDYDLHVTPGVLKIKADDSSATDSVSVKIKCREISQVSNVQIITADALPSDYKVQYYWTINNEIKSKVELKGSSISVPTTDFKENSLLTVELLYNNEVVDVAYVECVRSGKDGKTSNHVELSNDYDQVYVTDGVTKFTFEYNINVSLYDGNDKLEINSSDVIIPESKSGLYSTTIHPVNKQTNEVPVTITINSGTVFTEKIKTIQIPIKVGELGAVKNFTLVKLSGEMDYDLYVKPDVVRLTQDENQNWVMDTDYFEILLWEKELGANAKAATQKDTLPSNYSIVVEGDGQPIDSLTKYGTSDSLAPSLGTYNIPLNEYGNAYKKLTVSLKCGDTLVDWAELAFLADGERGPQGERGLSGASSYYIDLSNDFDLLYFKDGQLLPGQTFNTEVRLYKGAQQHTIIDKSETPDDFTCTTINDKVIAGIECEVVDGVGHIDLNFDTINPTFPGKDLPKSFSYKVKLKQQVIENDGEPAREIELFKTIRLAAIEGTDDYDLKCSTTTISKDSTGQLYPNKPLPEISVTHRDLSGLKSSTTHLTTLDLIGEAGLSLKYQIDSEPEQDLGDVGDQENIQISTDIIEQVKDYMKVCLYKGDILLDYIYLDVVLDGANATLYYTDLSNDMDQIYVSESDNTLVDDIYIYTYVSIYEGNKLIPIQNTNWIHIDIPTDLECTYSPLVQENGSVRIELKFTKGKPISLNSNSYTIPISVTKPDGESSQAFLSKKFIIKVFKGTESFDLLLNHEVVNINNSGLFTADNIVVKVMRTVYGANAIPPTPFDWSDTHIVRCVINGNYTDAFDLPCGGESGSISLSTIDFDNVSSPIIEFKLYPKDYTSDDQYIDSAEVVITRDGTDGTNASLLTVDFSNDLDLIYVGKNGVLYPNQTVQTGIKCFYGIEPISVNDYSITITPNSDEAPEPTVTENADDNSTTVTFNFTDTSTAITHPALYYTVSVNYNGQVFLKTYKILVLASDVGYDLHANRTRLRYKENKILNEGDLQISVNKRTFGSNTELSLSITQKSELPEGLTVYCGTTTDNTNILNSFTIGYGTYQSWTTPRYIRLVKDGLEIDQIVIDILKDGEKGNKGADGVSINITPISDTIYLNKLNNLLGGDLTLQYLFSLANYNIKNCVVKDGSSEIGRYDTNNSLWTYTVARSKTGESGNPENITYNVGIKTYLVELTDEKNNIYTTSLVANFVEGTVTYDLITTPSLIKLNNSDTLYPPIVLTAKRKTVGGRYVESENIIFDGSDELTFSVSVGGSADTNISWTGRYEYKPTSDDILTFKAKDGDGDLVDFQIITIVRDGAGFDIQIPTNPSPGDVIQYGEKVYKANVLLYPQVYGGTYTYVSSYFNFGPLGQLIYSCIVPIIAIAKPENYNIEKAQDSNKLLLMPIYEEWDIPKHSRLDHTLGDTYLTIEYQKGMKTALDLQRYVFNAIKSLSACSKESTVDNIGKVIDSPIYKVKCTPSGHGHTKYFLSAEILQGNEVYIANSSVTGLLNHLYHEGEGSTYRNAVDSVFDLTNYVTGTTNLPSTVTMYLLFMLFLNPLTKDSGIYDKHSHLSDVIIKTVSNGASSGWILTHVPNMPNGWLFGFVATS